MVNEGEDHYQNLASGILSDSRTSMVTFIM